MTTYANALEMGSVLKNKLAALNDSVGSVPAMRKCSPAEVQFWNVSTFGSSGKDDDASPFDALHHSKSKRRAFHGSFVVGGQVGQL